MKTWIGIALFIALSLGLGLGSIMLRQQSLDEMALLLDSPEAERGLALVNQHGCTACHSLDGRRGIGPTFLGMYGREEQLQDGSTIVADEAYLRESIENPGARIVAGYDNIMLRYAFSEQDMAAIIAFARAIGEEAVAESTGDSVDSH